MIKSLEMYIVNKFPSEKEGADREEGNVFFLFYNAERNEKSISDHRSS